ncbi:hypothetical protein CRYUN_Cryun04dG0185900 [Craigia yunnanensis]
MCINCHQHWHWVDRGSSSFSLEGDTRKSLHLQSVSETVVQEIRKLLLKHHMLVMATKTAILGNRYSMNDSRWNYRKWSAMDNLHLRNVTSSYQQVPYREYMPAVWQLIAFDRIILSPLLHTGFTYELQMMVLLIMSIKMSIYLSEWLLPPLNSLDKFIMRDQTGVFVLS